MQIWETQGLQLSVSGSAAPASSELISAQFTYGSAGTCQGGTVSPINVAALGRDTEWFFSLGGQPVFRGIPDGISDADGQLASVSLLPPHRPWMGALIINEPGHVVPGDASPYETVGDAISRAMEHNPNGDYGVRPDGAEIRAEPSYGDVYTLDSRASNLRYLGSTYPDAVTDAVFDPGEGWKKYVYQRATPPYALRKKGTATADPAIITQQDKATAIIRQTDALPPIVENGVTHSYNNIIETDNIERMYAEVDSTKTAILSDVGVWAFAIPKDNDVRRSRKIKVRCPFFVAAIAPYPPFARVNFVPLGGGITLTPVIGGGTLFIDTTAPGTIASAPAPLPNGATLEQVSAKVNEQADYLKVVKSQTDTVNSALAAARNDLGNLAQRVNQLTSNTTNSSGNLVNLADEIKKTQDKLNDLGTSVQAMDTASRTPRDTPKKGELKLLVSLVLVQESGTEVPLNTSLHVFKEQDIGLELAIAFDMDAQATGTKLKVRYEMVEQDTGKSITIIFRPLEVVVDYDTPNVAAVKMPDGWELPFRTEPRFEFRLPGWHIPPLRISGLPSGLSQMAAGTTVTWHRGEASTLVTTAAWGYG